MSKLKVYQPKNPNMPRASWCVFNIHANEKSKAIEAFIEKFGLEKYASEIKPRIADGIMGIFKETPNRHTVFFVNFMARLVDERFKDKWPENVRRAQS